MVWVFAALRAIRKAGYSDALPLVRRVYAELQRPGATFIAGGHSAGDIRAELYRAYADLAPKAPNEVEWMADQWASGAWASLEAAGASVYLNEYLRNRGWTPELIALFSDRRAAVRERMETRSMISPDAPRAVRDRYLNLAFDPDPKLRSIVVLQLRSASVCLERGSWEEPLRQFLARPDLPLPIREAAGAGLARLKEKCVPSFKGED